MNENSSNELPPGEGGTPENGDAPLNTGRPAVAAAPGKMLFVILFAGIFIFIIVRSLFFSGKEPVKEVEHRKERVVTGTKENEPTIAAGALPSAPTDLPTSQALTPPPPPPPPPTPPAALLTPPTPDIRAGAPTNEALSKRIHSSMFVTGSGTAAALARSQAAAKRNAAVAGGNDPNTAFAQSVAQSKAEEAIATRVPRLDSTIVQGKLIHAVLESAIQSDLPGPIRGIVSHDVYAEAGREILIPKGSRLVGIYNSSIRHGQARVFIIWQRVIRPDGIDVAIESPGVDSLGRAGMGGDVDNKYFEMFSAALLTSSLDIGVAAVGDALFGDQQTTTTNNGTGSTTTSSPTAEAMQQAVQSIGQVGGSIVNKAINTTPVINIDQGTPINVFVNRDLIFPREVTRAGGGFIN